MSCLDQDEAWVFLGPILSGLLLRGRAARRVIPSAPQWKIAPHWILHAARRRRRFLNIWSYAAIASKRELTVTVWKGSKRAKQAGAAERTLLA